jgi:gliding motility-associated-like protein
MKYLIYLLAIFSLISSCKDKKKDVPSTSNTPTYTNACCCNAIFASGDAKVFIPSMFTPNGDNLNDLFKPIGNSNTKYIYNVLISDVNGEQIYQIDTSFGINNSRSWDGYINTTTKHRGIINVSCQVKDINNNISSITAQSCSFFCDVPSSIINYLPNCKFEDMYDPMTGTTPYITKESSCFY